ncbi:uncharacterized protein LOC129549462 isoform X2 [Moschus berezovskii]|uniref:uncharacterized protein LOC129549462 isoform X2 n=1 Tax=Moschus berezovskii TaxID=68408 RepID=UPI002444B422|nr:uncharacterized protein LOC129549462 isoform X2 [Moschus berezovskii]
METSVKVSNRSQRENKFSPRKRKGRYPAKQLLNCLLVLKEFRRNLRKLRWTHLPTVDAFYFEHPCIEREPQLRNGEGPPRAQAPLGTPPLGRRVPPARAQPQPLLRVCVPVCLPGESARPSSFHLQPSEASLLALGKFSRTCSDRRRPRLRSAVRSGAVLFVGLSAATEMFRARSVQHSKPLTTGRSRGLEVSCS